MSLAQDLYDFAVQNYNNNFGWSVVVECWSLEDIAKRIGPAKNLDEAIAEFADLVEAWDDRYADAVNSAF